MKTLFKMMAIMLPLCVFSQEPLPVSAKDQQIAKEVLQNNKAIDSIKKIKAIDVKKQIHLIAMIKKEIEKLQRSDKMKNGDDLKVIALTDSLKALKQDTEAIYWEEIPRKWTGRIFNKEDTKIRLFRFDEGRKVYIN